MNPYIRLPRVPLVHSRQALILTKSTGKRVLHLGCVDAGLLHERFQRRELLHQKLADVAHELWGVDIDAEGIAFLRSKGFDHLIQGDICELDKIQALQGQQFDIVVASEVMEHLQNPGLFLQAARTLMIPGHTELIITIPNAFRIDTLLWLLRGVEFVHPDHNYWFSYHTVTNLVRKNGFAVSEVYAYSFQSVGVLPGRVAKFFHRAGDDKIRPGQTATVSSTPSPFLRRVISYARSLPKRLVTSSLYRTTPFWGDGIIIVAQRNEDQQ